MQWVGVVINFITTDSYANSISATVGSNTTKGITLKIHRNIDNHSISVIADGNTVRWHIGGTIRNRRRTDLMQTT